MKELEGKPFAMIGVHVHNSDPKKLKAAMVKEEMNWRSFAHQEAISTNWNEPGTPTYYVLDDKGVIQYKWVGNPGAKAIDSALEKLIKAVEKER